MKVRVVNAKHSDLKIGATYEVKDTRPARATNPSPFQPTVHGTILLKNGPTCCGCGSWYSWHHFEKVEAVCAV